MTKTLQQKMDAIFDWIQEYHNVGIQERRNEMDKAIQELREEIDRNSFIMQNQSRAIMTGILLKVLIGEKTQ